MPQIFPFYLAITQAWVPPVIQIADITGPARRDVRCWSLSNGALYDALMAVARAARAVAGGTAPFDWRAPAPAGRDRGGRRVRARSTASCASTRSTRAAPPRPRPRSAWCRPTSASSRSGTRASSRRLVDLHQSLSADLQREGADLIVWPESSYPYVLSRDMQQDFPRGDRARDPRRGFDKPLLFGAVTRTPGRRARSRTTSPTTPRS